MFKLTNGLSPGLLDLKLLLAEVANMDIAIITLAVNPLKSLNKKYFNAHQAKRIKCSDRKELGRCSFKM